MAVMNEDTRFEDAYREGGSDSNMCEYLDRIEARGESRGEARGEARGLERGKIEGTIETCRRFGLDDAQILKELMTQFQLTEQDALGYLKDKE